MKRKPKTGSQKTPGLSQQFVFTLPGHVISRCPEDKVREICSHVWGDVYSFPEIKIQVAPAEPPNTEEQVKRALLAYCSPPHEENVVTASADAEKALATLARLARAGNGKALWQFAEIVKSAVGGLNEIAASNPDAIKPYARHSDRWPMLRSTAPLLCGDDTLLKKIQLGTSAGVQLDKFSKWKPDYAAAVAVELIGHIEFIRRENPIVVDGKREIEFSKFLPPFNEDTAAQWWFIAEKFFLATYPKPEEIAVLDALVTAKSKRTSPGRRRLAIREKIRARFLALACQS